MLNEHHHRRAVVAEMHLRRWPPLRAPTCVIQLVRVLGDYERGVELAAVAARSDAGAPNGSGNPRHLEGQCAEGLTFSWERHSEASTTTLFVEGKLPRGRPSHPALDEALAWACALPGAVIRAIRLVVVETEAEAEALLPFMGFSEEDMISCRITAEGAASAQQARLWSDFRLGEGGFGGVLVSANGMAPGALSRVLQRLQELGNYRNLALLGLPLAREGWHALDQIEAELGDINRAVAQPETTDDELLERVSRLSMALIAQTSEADYRMSATQAYATIVEERLADLHIAPCDGFLSLADFTQRRFLPAVRTCAAHQRRSERLAQRTAQVVSLLRTRVETRIENQNGLLLLSMERSATRQFRLQQLVEGLSVVAVSYYALALAGKVLEGVEPSVPGLHAHLVTAVLAPFVILGTWLALHRRKRRILHTDDH